MHVIVEIFDATGMAPTMQELADELGIRKSGAFRLLTCLEARGWIAKIPGHARAITILHRPPMREEDVFTLSDDVAGPELLALLPPRKGWRIWEPEPANAHA